MIALFLNGEAVPSTLLVGAAYSLAIKVDGGDPLYQDWTLSTVSATVSTGVSNPALLQPTAPETHYLHVAAAGLGGRVEEAIFPFQVVARRRTAAAVEINWERLSWTVGETLRARVRVRDPEGLTARSVSWTLFRNGSSVQTGDQAQVEHVDAAYGLYRVVATGVDAYGNATSADSSVAITGNFEVQAAVLPAQPGPTMQYLGALYTYAINGNAAVCSVLPYPLASFTQEIKLLPGTTHFTLELDTDSRVDDEVVVRTQIGNWTLRGAPTGLDAEAYVYDYQRPGYYLPAPMDLRVMATCEAVNVHGATASAFSFRVKVKCWRTGLPIFEYTRCAWSHYPGGSGARERRLIALVTDLDAYLDAETDLNRQGSGALERLSLPDQTKLICQLKPTGSPDRSNPDTGASETAANIVSVYEPAKGYLPEIDVHATHGIAGYRPGCLNFVQFGNPRIAERIKRLYGRLVVYVSGGAFSAGTVITVRIQTGKSPGYTDVVVPVATDVYQPDLDAYLKVGEAAIDLSDFEFDRMGLVTSFNVNEASASSGSIGHYPVPALSGTNVYAPTQHPAIRIDGACYVNPQAVPLLEDADVYTSFGTIPNCADISCGPVGLYCYMALAGSTTAEIVQPLHFPAPFVAYQQDQAVCYGNPSLLYEMTANGTQSPVFAYSGTTGCGVGYRYAPCTGTTTNLAVVYPASSTPHDFVSYGSVCWAYSGSVADLRLYTVLLAEAVEAVVSCADTACTGSNAAGSSVTYQDVESLATVNVQFPHLATGYPRWGVIPEKVDTGVLGFTPGQFFFTASHQLSRVEVVTFGSAARVRFRVSKGRYACTLIVARAGVDTRHALQASQTSLILDILAADRVFLDFSAIPKLRPDQAPGSISWDKVVELPRVYDTAVVATAGSTTLTALGFCGLSARSPYAFYSALPADTVTSEPNPDSFVTVSGTNLSQELVLVRSRAAGDPEPVLPNGVGWFAGETLVGPMTFRFYASREAQGAHGEMDLWQSGTHAFPQYFTVTPHKSLQLKADYYRRIPQAGDTQRNSMRVSATGTNRSPRVFAAADGERLSVSSTAGTVLSDGKVFVYTGTVDYGVSRHATG